MTTDGLPYITDDLPGIGGRLKSAPSDFVVEEIPLYEPSGEGDHVYLTIRREGRTTREVTEALARLLSCYETDVGAAGLKDKHARVTQAISVYYPAGEPAELGHRVEDALQVEVLQAVRHRNKLKTGHLLGNRFVITIGEVGVEGLEPARVIAQALLERGVPNFYGDQRFGNTGDNALKGREVLEGGGPRPRWLRRFLVSAYLSSLFNTWLQERIGRGEWDRIFVGDIAKKAGTGGLFEVTDAVADQARLERHEITWTGPIFGSRLTRATGRPGEIESELESRAGLGQEVLRRHRANGTRRAGRLLLESCAITPRDGRLEFSFALPKGSYATTVMREFMKSPTVVEGLEEDRVSP